jgi:hypothetical protein
MANPRISAFEKEKSMSLQSLSKSKYVFVLFFLVTGCATVPPGPRFQTISDIPDGKGVIYIYKPDNYGKSIYQISVNGIPVTRLYRNSYFPYVASPGINIITGVKQIRAGEILTTALGLEPDIKIEVNVEAGQSYYIERKGASSPKFESVPESKALPLLEDTVLLVPIQTD